MRAKMKELDMNRKTIDWTYLIWLTTHVVCAAVLIYIIARSI